MISRRLATVTLAALGLAIGIYLSAVDLSAGQVRLACSSSGLANCDLVTSSAQSRVGPMPVAVLGAVWFAVMLALSLLVGSARGVVGAAALMWTGAALVVVFYLIYAELFLIGAVCVWCTVLHALMIGLFLLSLAGFVGRTVAEEKDARSPDWPGADAQ